MLVHLPLNVKVDDDVPAIVLPSSRLFSSAPHFPLSLRFNIQRMVVFPILSPPAERQPEPTMAPPSFPILLLLPSSHSSSWS